MRIFLYFSLCLCLCAAAAGQTKVFRWTTHSCDHEGVYDASKFTALELRNTYRMALTDEFDVRTDDATVWKWEEIATLPPVSRLDREFRVKSDALKNLKIVRAPYWERYRGRKLNELEQTYRLARVTILGYTRPAALRELTFADACVRKYADPLIEGGDRLLDIWREVNQESRKNNADPERLRTIFDRQMNSPEKNRYAVIEVMAFGWWNCANALIDRGDDFAEVEKNFQKLFRRTKSRCEEP